MKSQPQPNLVRGTPLDEKALRHGKTFSVTYAPKLRYAWDTGQAISRYLAELKEGRLIARACRKCERVMIPPRMFCERCLVVLNFTDFCTFGDGKVTQTKRGVLKTLSHVCNL